MSRDAHSRHSGGTEEPLYDTTVRTPTHGERVRTLAASVSTGALCTIARDPAGFPFGSFVTFALDGADPVFFISLLAEHTKNLQADTKASLLVVEPGEGDPLARGRVTLLGTASRVEEGPDRERVRESYLAAHPNARYYIDYSDFGFWRLGVEAVRYIGGYGRMSWVDLGEYRAGEADPIAPHAGAIIGHMNADHADALVACCRAFSKATDVTEAVMTGVDRYGFEMSARTTRGPRPIRLGFATPIATPEDARREMVALTRRARQVVAERS